MDNDSLWSMFGRLARLNLPGDSVRQAGWSNTRKSLHLLNHIIPYFVGSHLETFVLQRRLTFQFSFKLQILEADKYYLDSITHLHNSLAVRQLMANSWPLFSSHLKDNSHQNYCHHLLIIITPVQPPPWQQLEPQDIEWGTRHTWCFSHQILGKQLFSSWTSVQHQLTTM